MLGTSSSKVMCPISTVYGHVSFFTLNLIVHFNCLGIQTHANNLAEILEMEMRPESREEHLNTVKMTVYLLCQFIELIESDASKPSAIVSGKVEFFLH